MLYQKIYKQNTWSRKTERLINLIKIVFMYIVQCTLLKLITCNNGQFVADKYPCGPFIEISILAVNLSSFLTYVISCLTVAVSKYSPSVKTV